MKVVKVLLVDDDPQILRALRITLKAKGYEVITATDGQQGIDAAIATNPDMYVLDLGMPKLNGEEVIQAIRGWSTAPILVVSGRSGSADKVEALDAGADDYVTKPFAIDELLARLRALSRRITKEPSANPVIKLGSVVIDMNTHIVRRVSDGHDEAIRLTPTEWNVLEVLCKNVGKLVTRQTLLTEIWGTDHVTDTGYLRLYISQLRRKIEPDPSNPQYILTDAGMGYRLETDD